MSNAIDDNPSSRTTIIRPPSGLAWPDLREVWNYRELLSVLIYRDIQVRYKQTLIGLAWAVIQPLVTIGVFSIVFGRLAKMPSDGIPYPIFSLAALLPWNLFVRALTQGSLSLVTMQGMLTKVYFPPLLAPLASVFSGLVDFIIGLVILGALMAWYGVGLSPSMLWFPAFVLLALATSLGISLMLAGINVKYRDVQFALPFAAQVGLFLTPVVYPVSIVPEFWRPFYMLNPMAGVIEGVRWSLFGIGQISAVYISISVVVAVALLVLGSLQFGKSAQTFADSI